VLSWCVNQSVNTIWIWSFRTLFHQPHFCLTLGFFQTIYSVTWILCCLKWHKMSRIRPTRSPITVSYRDMNCSMWWWIECWQDRWCYQMNCWWSISACWRQMRCNLLVWINYSLCCSEYLQLIPNNTHPYLSTVCRFRGICSEDICLCFSNQSLNALTISWTPFSNWLNYQP
jgi:hypothetical protein